jgi:hypothetical protein
MTGIFYIIIMKKLISFSLFCFALVLVSCNRSNIINLSLIDPGSYDTTWWNHTPLRFIQTNLNELDAGMDEDLYVQSLVNASVNLVLLNVGGIVASYPSELPYHYRNPYLKGDMVGNLVTKLHSKGIKVIGRFDFSKINETLAFKNPEWLYVGTDGKYVNYNGQVHTCINGAYQQEYGFGILKEAITTYPLDAIFFNMGGYQTSDYSEVYHGICQCENCKKRFRDSTGFAIPKTADVKDPVFRQYKVFQTSTSQELFLRIKNFTRGLNPNLVLVHETGELIRSESGTSYTSGEDWNYHGTENVKEVVGSYRDKSPIDNLNYFMGMDFRHTATSPNIGRIYLIEQMLNGGSTGIYVMGRLENQYDRIFLQTFSDLFGFHKTNEKLFTNLTPLSKVGLVMGSTPEYRGIMKLLTEEHIMFDLIKPSAVGSKDAPRKLEEYNAIILGNVTDMDDAFISIIDNYVNNGGKLLATGFAGINDEIGTPLNRLRLQSLGVMADYEMFPRTKSTYLKVDENDKSALGEEEFKDFDLIMMYSDFLKCKANVSAMSYLKLIPNAMHGPPEKCYIMDSDITDFPGVIANSFGKGKAVFIPWQIGSQYGWKGNNGQRALFMAALHKLLKVENALVTDASPLIEMTWMGNRNGSFEWIGMINHSGQIGNSFREPASIHNTAIRFKPQKQVKELWLMRSGTGLKFKQKDGWVECVVQQIDDFEMMVCLYK